MGCIQFSLKKSQETRLRTRVTEREQCLCVALLIIMLYDGRVLNVESVSEILKCENSNESN